MGRISRYSLTTAIQSIRLDGGRRVVLRTDGDIQIAYDLGDFDNEQMFDVKADEVFVFDPSPITGEVDALDYLFYAKATTTATVQVWIQ